MCRAAPHSPLRAEYGEPPTLSLTTPAEVCSVMRERVASLLFPGRIRTMRLPDALDRLWRRRFGTFEIDDPRPIAKEAPYTYFLPSDEQLAAIQPGDLVKIVIRSLPAARKWDA